MNKAAPGLLFVVGQLGLGGLERQLYYLLEGLSRRGLVPQVAVWNFSDADHWVRPIEALGLRIRAVEGRSSFQKLSNLRRLVGKKKPTVVHSYSFHTNFGVWYSSIGNHTVALGAVRNTLRFSIRTAGRVRGLLCATLPRVQVYNSFFAASEAGMLPRLLRPSTVKVIPNCTDLDTFRPAPFPSEAVIQIVGIGRLAKEKRWDVFLDTLRVLREMKVQFSARIYGEGPLRSSILQWISTRSLESCVSVMGVGDTRKVLEGAHVLLHSADAEGTPNVVLEALACGRPIVATGVGDVTRYIRDSETGFVVKPGDSRTMAEHLASLAGNWGMMEKMGRAARRVAERECSLDLLVEMTLALYRSLGVEVS